VDGTGRDPAGEDPAGSLGEAGDLVGSSAAPTIYDVARAAGVSIASVSRVLNGQRNPRQETRDRVLAAVAELGFAPDGAARALSARLKEVVGVIVRRPWRVDLDEDLFSAETDSLQYPDLINRGIEAAAQRRGFDLLIRSVGITEHDAGGRTLALARKSDGLILHDRVLEPDEMDRLSRQLPIVTLAGYATPTTANVHGDNRAGMQALARHLIRDHGYPTLAYLGGYADSPDSIERREVLAAEAAAAGATLDFGPGGPGRGDRLRRHPDGAPPGHQPDHRPPADQGAGDDGLRRAVFDAQPGEPPGPRHRAAHRADPQGELRLRGPGRHPPVPDMRPDMRPDSRRPRPCA